MCRYAITSSRIDMSGTTRCLKTAIRDSGQCVGSKMGCISCRKQELVGSGTVCWAIRTVRGVEAYILHWYERVFDK